LKDVYFLNVPTKVAWNMREPDLFDDGRPRRQWPAALGETLVANGIWWVFAMLVYDPHYAKPALWIHLLFLFAGLMIWLCTGHFRNAHGEVGRFMAWTSLTISLPAIGWSLWLESLWLGAMLR
jgi:hypothetical protein